MKNFIFSLFCLFFHYKRGYPLHILEWRATRWSGEPPVGVDSHPLGRRHKATAVEILSGPIKVTSRTEGSKNRILENLCERVIEIYSWENWKLGKYDPLLGLIFKIF